MERGHAFSVRRFRARIGAEGAFALPLALMTVLVTGSLASSAIAYSSWDYGGGPIIARRISLANSSVNHYVPIGTLMPGMPATYEDVVTITNEPGSWG